MTIGYNQLHQDFNRTFKLEHDTDIRQFFPADKSVREKVSSQLKRFAHLLQTGVVINEKQICKWADKHADDSLASLLEGKVVQRKVVRHEAHMVVPKSTVLSRFKDNMKFLGEFILHPTRVGAILPSSEGLAKEISSEIPKDLKATPRLILEVGPGTGIFSDKIIKRMNPQDELHLVEFDETFANQLKERYKHISNVKVIQGDILQHENKGVQYDYVISGLPLNGFKADFVSRVFDKFTQLTKPGGKISYFEYLGIPTIKLIFSKPAERENLREILHMKKAFYDKHNKNIRNVLLNAPCARVLHHEIKAN
ncbi:MAG: methyltransferase domain-containing protein [Chlamydiales bacterium]|nr:methyltransferase domain-containing protein [Chlamydiales bacterium]